MHIGLCIFSITALQGDLKAKDEILQNVKNQLEKSNKQLAEAMQQVATFRYKWFDI